MPGLIKLILPNGTREKEVYYFTPKNRKSIIESWIILYGDKFENFFVHIQPHTEKHFILNHNFKIK